MQDVSVELLKKLNKKYKQAINGDTSVNSFLKKLEKNKADFNDMYLYARKTSKYASDCVRAVLSEDNVPNGVIYWNILKSVLEPFVESYYNDINEKASKIQKRLWKSKGFSVKPVITEFKNDDRLYRLMNLINNTSENNNESVGAN
jgi:hypothetical protein